MILEIKVHDSIAEQFKAFLELFPKSKIKIISERPEKSHKKVKKAYSKLSE